MIALRDPVAAPAVVQRRRLELADLRISGSKQPYHAAERMTLKDAEEFIRERAESSLAMARNAVDKALAELSKKGHVAHEVCVIAASGRPSPSLAATLKSHALIHTAEGDFYRDVIRRACESAGLKTTAIKEKDLRVQMSEDERAQRISEMGKLIGPPWTQDEKLSALAAWLLLDESQAVADRERMASICLK
jgi:predicted ArsR family transcriptional regulator